MLEYKKMDKSNTVFLCNFFAKAQVKSIQFSEVSTKGVAYKQYFFKMNIFLLQLLIFSAFFLTIDVV